MASFLRTGSEGKGLSGATAVRSGASRWVAPPTLTPAIRITPIPGSASAEGADRIAGSVLGVIERDGGARWTALTGQDGSPFRGKIEGLWRDLREPHKVHFVIDDDDETVPSELFEATLGEGFFRA